MKSILITLKNKDKIDALFVNIQKRCKARLMNYDKLESIVWDHINYPIQKFVGAKKDLIGVRFSYFTPNQINFPVAYAKKGFSYNTTFVVIRKTKDGWRLDEAKRISRFVKSNEKHINCLSLPDKTRDSIQKKAILDFTTR